MRLFAGVAARDPERRTDRQALVAMAARVRAADPHVLVRDRIGLLVAGVEHPGTAQPGMTIGGDVDVTNAGEVCEIGGADQVLDALGALYRREGAAALRRLRGAFALAIWDEARAELVLAVDQLGIGRLYVAERPDAILFATRVGALVGPGGVAGEADPAALYQYLNFGFVPAPGSPFRGVRRLEPGHVLRVRGATATVERYWDLAYSEVPVPEPVAADRTYRAVEAAVARALGEGPAKECGAFLSGGTDSSTVLGLACRLTGERVEAFSIGFREPRYDELRYAEIAARHFGASHHTAVVAPDEALGALSRLVEAYDEPFGNNSAIGTYLCARLARETGVSRLLAGDGGDEIFGGNERYRTDRVFARYHAVPRPVRRRVIEPVLSLWPAALGGPLARAQRYVRRASIPNPRRFYSYSFFFAGEGRRLLAPEWLAGLDPEAPWGVVERHFAEPRASSELNRLLYLDLKLAIADNDLLKVVRTADAAGVRVRFPLLDVPLVELAATFPCDLKVRRLEKRYVFKRAFQGLLPPEVLAKTKHGFGVPTALWLKSHRGFRELARDTLLSGAARQRGLFRPGALEELFALHARDATAYYGDVLWTVLMLELWQRRWVDGAAGA